MVHFGAASSVARAHVPGGGRASAIAAGRPADASVVSALLYPRCVGYFVRCASARTRRQRRWSCIDDPGRCIRRRRCRSLAACLGRSECRRSSGPSYPSRLASCVRCERARRDKYGSRVPLGQRLPMGEPATPVPYRQTGTIDMMLAARDAEPMFSGSGVSVSCSNEGTVHFAPSQYPALRFVSQNGNWFSTGTPTQPQGGDVDRSRSWTIGVASGLLTAHDPWRRRTDANDAGSTGCLRGAPVPATRRRRRRHLPCRVSGSFSLTPRYPSITYTRFYDSCRNGARVHVLDSSAVHYAPSMTESVSSIAVSANSFPLLAFLFTNLGFVLRLMPVCAGTLCRPSLYRRSCLRIATRPSTLEVPLNASSTCSTMDSRTTCAMRSLVRIYVRHVLGP